MTYGELAPYLKAWAIKIRDREYNPLTEQEAKHRLVDSIQAGKVKPDILVITMK